MAPELVLDDIASWAPALWHDHTVVAAEDRQVARTINCYIASMPPLGIELGSDPELLPVLFKILESNSICGFSEDQFVFGCDVERVPYFVDTVLPYVVNVFGIIRMALAALCELCRHHDHDEHSRICKRCAALDSERPVRQYDICQKLAQFLTMLRRIRHSIAYHRISIFSLPAISSPLGWDAEGTTRKEFAVTQGQLGNLIRVVTYIVMNMMSKFKSDLDVDGPFGEFVFMSMHVLADAWLMDGSTYMRQLSLKRTVEIFDSSMGLEWTPLHGEQYPLLVDGFHPRAIQSAILLDLRSSSWEVREVPGEIDRFDLFHSLISFAVMLREQPLETMDALRTSRTECGIFWHALAASRTLLCSREYGPEPPKFFTALDSMGYYSSIVVGDIHSSEVPPIPELWVFALANNFAGSVALVVDRTPSRVLELMGLWLERMHHLGHMFQYYRTHPNDQSRFRGWPGSEQVPPSVRRYVHTLWLLAERGLTQRKLRAKFRGVEVKELIKRWRNFRRKLDDVMESVGGPEIVFGPLERCAWSACACSVFEPTHAMKVCTRCRFAAYCGKRCQKMDYRDHRIVCRR